MAVSQPTHVVDVITDFLAARPTAQEIIAFRLPVFIEQRASELLARRREDRLTAEERIEFEDFMRMEQFMTILKAKARLKEFSKL